MTSYPFIRETYIEDLALCDQLIDYFESSSNKFEGHTSYGVDKAIKDSTDCYLADTALTELYVKQLILAANEYAEAYPYANYYAPWGITETINIQKYNPGQGYHGWHTERGTANSTRHLVFMTYLNTIEDGGETEFYHQDLKVKPKKGLTVIWPAEWTFTHRGCPSSETKYIVTGWFNFLE